MHACEIALANGLVPSHVGHKPGQCRLEIAGVGQLASPFQAAWVMSNLLKNIHENFCSLSTFREPMDIMQNIASELLRERDVLLGNPNKTPSNRIFEQAIQEWGQSPALPAQVDPSGIKAVDAHPVTCESPEAEVPVLTWGIDTCGLKPETTDPDKHHEDSVHLHPHVDFKSDPPLLDITASHSKASEAGTAAVFPNKGPQSASGKSNVKGSHMPCLGHATDFQANLGAKAPVAGPAAILHPTAEASAIKSVISTAPAPHYEDDSSESHASHAKGLPS